MTMSELLKQLDDHAVEDAASAVQIAPMRSALVATFGQPEHAPWSRLAPEVYGVSEPGEPAAGVDE